MNNERLVPRRKLLEWALLSLGGVITSCATSTESPFSPQKKPVPTPKIFSPTIIPDQAEFPFSSAYLQNDFAIKTLIEQAQKHEIIKIENILIGYIFRFPWEKGEAYIATLETINQEEKTQTTALLLSADCLYEALRKDDALGSNLLPGIWHPQKRIDFLKAEVAIPSEIGVPVAILNLKDLCYQGSTQNCEEETAIERLKETITKIKWDQLPQETGEFIGWFSKEFLKGLKRGIQ